ncbi:hypothetical protein WG66_007368 [Moniliophthora roreri]|uniref:Uncharacterized protein n=1 Tax=Moniliophthora roreri TaxID=221103 RepID=A0A0W0F020_MONRR|nr:hypothetical protein WG66_007368 [Moniliophthora roreri]
MATTSLNEPRFPGTTSIRNLPVEVLLRHTALPPDRDIIEQLVSDTEKKLAGYQVQIDKLRVSLTFLEYKRDGLKKKLSQYRSLLSPVHRLPPEILQNIFTMFNDLLEEERWLRPSEMAPALAVSRVCGRSRDIALSIPSIWSSVAIRFEEWNDQEYRRMNLLTRLYVDHSQKSPLNLILHFDKLLNLDYNVGTIPIPILKTLVQHSERWHTIEFRFITQAVMAHQVFKPITGHLPILTSLRLFGQGGRSLDFRCNLFSDCPALSSLSFEPAGPLTVHCPLPWRQIKSLQIENAFLSSMISTASLCPRTERLAIKWCGGGTYTGNHLSIPHVTRLSIVAEDADEAYCAFKHLTLQGLSSLEISCTSDDDEGEVEDITWKDWNERHIVDFFRRSSGCLITSLSLKYVPISGKQLIQFLHFMPALSSLRLEESSHRKSTRTITRQFLQRLTIDDMEASPFLPKLTDIRLVLREDGLAESVLPNALISRWIPDDTKFKTGVKCIKSVDVVFIAESKEIAGILTSKLRLLRDAGVRVTVTMRIQEAVDGDRYHDYDMPISN